MNLISTAKNYKGVIAAAMLIAVTSTIIGVSANANNAKPVLTPENQAKREEQKAINEAARQQMDAAIESGSFDTFKTYASTVPMGQKMLEKITTENFSKLVEAHNNQKQAMELMEKSRTLMQELGFEDFHRGPGRKMMRMMRIDERGERQNEQTETPQE